MVGRCHASSPFLSEISHQELRLRPIFHNRSECLVQFDFDQVESLTVVFTDIVPFDHVKGDLEVFSTPALNTVGPSFPPHFTQTPFNGARRGFQLHFEHRDLCDVNVRKFPTKSRRICVPRTFLATSSPFTATILSARSSCSLTFSSIVGSSL